MIPITLRNGRLSRRNHRNKNDEESTHHADAGSASEASCPKSACQDRLRRAEATNQGWMKDQQWLDLNGTLVSRDPEVCRSPWMHFEMQLRR